MMVKQYDFDCTKDIGPKDGNHLKCNECGFEREIDNRVIEAWKNSNRTEVFSDWNIEDVQLSVLGVVKGSPAEKSGLKPGDNILLISTSNQEIIKPHINQIQDLLNNKAC